MSERFWFVLFLINFATLFCQTRQTRAIVWRSRRAAAQASLDSEFKPVGVTAT